MKRLFAILLVLASAGCTSQLTRAGSTVRPVPLEQASRCTRVGSVEGSGANGASATENERAAVNGVRNQVARLGGNAFAITSRDTGAWRSVVRADAYRCPEWEPVPGLAPR